MYKKGYLFYLGLLLVILLAACGQMSDGEPPEDIPLTTQALNFVVTSLSDEPDAAPGNGVCAAWFGGCTLRAAIEEANASPGKDHIDVPIGSYILDHGKLSITDDVVVMGERNGSIPTIVDGNANGTVIYIDNQANENRDRIRVELHYLTVRNGTSSGIINMGGEVLVKNSKVMENIDFSSGGGIGNYDNGIMELNRTWVKRNGDMATHKPARAGGIKNAEGSYMLISKSTVSENEANRFGGVANYGFMNIVNSTISKNKGRIDTGGVLNVGMLALNNATIAANEGTIEKDGSGGSSAGGLHSADGTVFIGNSIVGNNKNLHSSAGDCYGTILSVGYNLIEDTTDCTINGDLTGNLTNVDPGLFGLAYNGGPTPSHALQAGSPARNAANPAVPNGVGTACEATDQHTMARGFGAAGRCDMGAFELNAGPGGFAPK